MSRLAASSALLVLALGCAETTPPPVTPVDTSPPIQAPIAAPEPPSPDTADDNFRYHPPEIAPRNAFTAPTPQEIRLSNGARALLIERPGAGVVSIEAVVRWRSIPETPGLQSILASLLYNAAPRGGGPSLYTQANGWKWRWDDDAAYYTVSVAPQDLERVLGSFIDIVRQPIFSTSSIDLERERRQRLMEREQPVDALRRGAIEWLFPAGHLYRTTQPTKETLKKLDVARVDRYRKAALGPGALTLCVAGDVTGADLRGVLDRRLGPWKPSGAAAARRSPPRLAKGTLLIEDPSAAKTMVTVIAPAPAHGSADTTPMTAVVQLLRRGITKHLADNVKGYWSVSARMLPRADQPFFEVTIEVGGDEVPAAVQAVLAGATAISAGEFTEEALAAERAAMAGWMESRYDDLPDVAASMNGTPAQDAPLDWRATHLKATLALRRDDVRRAADTYLRKQNLRVVARGNVAAAKSALEAMGLGPVTVQTPVVAPARVSTR